jgi:hypothetical protein
VERANRLIRETYWRQVFSNDGILGLALADEIGTTDKTATARTAAIRFLIVGCLTSMRDK